MSARFTARLCLLLVGAAVACGLLDAEAAYAAPLKVVSAALAVLVVPGTLGVLLWRPRPHMTALELIGLGTALSIGIVQLLTVVAITGHVSAGTLVWVLAAASVLAAARVVRQGSGAFQLSRDEAIIGALLLGLSAALYALGSPVTASEDQVHAAIVQRLTHLPNPRLDNIYFAPGIVYTYPFPGIHYAMALVARMADVDPVFVYHKLRFLWGPAALVMLYLMARAVFGPGGVATAVAVTAAVFVGTGVFAMVPGFSWGWGQLAPFSHASDVAMTVLLPALLVVAFGYLRADGRRERAFFLTATLLLTLMLTAVHVRELVQFAVYLACFFMVAAVVRSLRPYLWPTAVLLSLVLVIGTVYDAWQVHAGPLYRDVLDERRADLMGTAREGPVGALVLAPASTMLEEFLPEFGHIWSGLTPVFLFAGPAVIVLFQRQPLVWLVASSTAAYLALMTVPLLAIPYIYLTYYEILYTPVRNIVFFVYLLAGAFLYAAIVALTQVDRTRLSLPVAGAIGGAVALLTALSVNHSHAGFFIPLIAAYALTFVFLARSGGLKASGYRRSWQAVVALTVSLTALVMLWPERSPVERSEQVTVRWRSELPDSERTGLEQQLSLAGGEPKPDRTEEVNVWNYRLTDLSRSNVALIVAHPDVVDTHFIDRSTLSVESQPPPGDHQFLGVTYVRWVQYPGKLLLVLSAVAIWLLAFVVPAMLSSPRYVQAGASLVAAMEEPFVRRAVPYLLFLAPFALWSARPTLSPLPLVERAASVRTPAAMFARLPCVTVPPGPAPLTEELLPDNPVMLPERTTCAPDRTVMEWIGANLPVDAVLANDLWNPYLPSVFIPQQVVVLPAFETAFADLRAVFSEYYRFFDARIRQYRVQPFFNAVETAEEREAFVDALGVTHVLIDPAYYDELRPVLDELSDRFALRYNQEKWAVYEVVKSGSSSVS